MRLIHDDDLPSSDSLASAVAEPPVAGPAWWEQSLAHAPGLGIWRARPAGVEADLLDGLAGTAADRAVAASLDAAEPRMRWWIAAHREFQRRAFAYARNTLGLRQVLDLGSGYETATGSVFTEVVGWEDRHPGQPLRYLGVDVDPIAAGRLRAHTSATPRHAGLRADITQVGAVCDFLRAAGGPLDFDAPMLVIAAGTLQHIADPGQVLTQLRERVAAGTILAVSHPALPEPASDALLAALDDYRAAVAPWWPRPAGSATEMLRAWTIVPGAVMPVGRWRPSSRCIGDEKALPEIAATPGWALLATTGPQQSAGVPGDVVSGEKW